MMNIKAKELIVLCLMITTLAGSCKESGEDLLPITDVITSSGNTIRLDGLWETGCVRDNGPNIQETFSFSENTLVIDISFFKDNSCVELAGSEKVTIDFQVVGTIEAMLDGNKVVANKIMGTQTLQSSGASKEFKQIFYIKDDGKDLVLHHARFQNDGGAQSSDGFPVELIPIDIVQL